MKLPDLLAVIMDIAKELIEAEGSSLLLADTRTGDLISYFRAQLEDIEIDSDFIDDFTVFAIKL